MNDLNAVMSRWERILEEDGVGKENWRVARMVADWAHGAAAGLSVAGHHLSAGELEEFSTRAERIAEDLQEQKNQFRV